jgi:gas vesicle protein
MDQKKTFKKMIELNQTTFDNIFNVTVLVQNRFERVANAALNQISGIPAEKRQSIENWAEAFKYSRNSLKKQIDKNFEQAEKLFIG